MNFVIVLSSLALAAQVVSTWITFGIRDLMTRRLWTPLLSLNFLLCLWCASSIYAVFLDQPTHHMLTSVLGVLITSTMFVVIRRLHRQLAIQRQKILDLAIAAEKELALAHAETESLALKLAHYFIERKGIANGDT